jgi:hypothetical protein
MSGGESSALCAGSVHRRAGDVTLPWLELLDMQRNWDLVRALLEAINEHPRFHPNAAFDETAVALEFDGEISAEVVHYHLTLLDDAGLLRTFDVPLGEFGPFGGNVRWGVGPVLGLSWKGHEFLDTIRDDTVWSKTKAQLLEKGGALTFELIKGVALGYLKAHLQLG